MYNLLIISLSFVVSGEHTTPHTTTLLVVVVAVRYYIAILLGSGLSTKTTHGCLRVHYATEVNITSNGFYIFVCYNHVTIFAWDRYADTRRLSWLAGSRKAQRIHAITIPIIIHS
uniref:Putative secreted peptide n=1 Tax=Anopheles braziliensis TaxID=58242 RepID=A0A2M3ZR05_9DIPT